MAITQCITKQCTANGGITNKCGERSTEESKQEKCRGIFPEQWFKGTRHIGRAGNFNTLRIKKEINGNGFKLNSTDYYETQVFRLGYSYKF